MRQLINESKIKAKKYKTNLMFASVALAFIGLFALIVNKILGYALVIISVISFVYAYNIKVEDYNGRD